MGKKVSVGVVIALVAITAAITFTLSYNMAMSKFNETVADVNERQQMYNKLSAIDQRVRQNYLGEIDESKLSDGICAGYIAGLADSKGQYMSAEKYKEFLAGTSENSVGIGVETIPDDDGNMEVVSVVPASPADQQGISKGDIIIKVGGKDVKRIGYSDATGKLDGAIGSSLDLELLRTVESGEESEDDVPASTLETVKLTIVRQAYEKKNIDSHLINETIGYISITKFTSQTVEQFQQEVESLIKQGAASLIFDVRNCSGGDVEPVGKILDYLLPAGNLIGTIDKAGVEEFQIQSDAKELDIPMAVLTNDGTYGAAELFASAIKDYKKAGIIGEKTAGRGTQDKVFPLSDGSAIVISIANYVTMNGQIFTGIGIEPTAAVALDQDQRALLNRKSLPEGADPQIQAAVTYLGGGNQETSSEGEQDPPESAGNPSSEGTE